MDATHSSTGDEPGRRPLRARPEQVSAKLAPETYRPLKELSEITDRTMRDLMEEAITRLLVAHDQPVPGELRRKFRRIALGLE